MLVLLPASCRWSQSLPSPDSGLRARLSWLASPSSLVGQWMGGGDLAQQIVDTESLKKVYPKVRIIYGEGPY